MSKYGEILQDLQRSIDDLKARGITVKALDHSLEELRRHSENIEKVESSIDAIQEEVMSPIKDELRENKQAARFSRWGAALGAAGLIATVWALYTTSDVALDERLAAIEQQLEVPPISSKSPEPGEFVIQEYRDVEILDIPGNTLKVELRDTAGGYDGEPLVAGLDFLLNGRKMGKDKRAQVVRPIHRQTGENIYNRAYLFGEIEVAVGDSMVIFSRYEFFVAEILDELPRDRDFGDSETSIRLRLLDEMSPDAVSESSQEPDPESPQN